MIRAIAESGNMTKAAERLFLSQSALSQQLKDIESYYINHNRPLGNDPSTKKGYKGNTIISFNTGKCFQKQKIVSNSENLVKLLKLYF